MLTRGVFQQPDKRQTGMGTQIVGQLFDKEVGHVLIHLQGESYMTVKLLISIDKLDFLTLNSWSENFSQ